jgi:hypothetical protein
LSRHGTSRRFNIASVTRYIADFLWLIIDDNRSIYIRWPNTAVAKGLHFVEGWRRDIFFLDECIRRKSSISTTSAVFSVDPSFLARLGWVRTSCTLTLAASSGILLERWVLSQCKRGYARGLRGDWGGDVVSYNPHIGRQRSPALVK